MELRGTALTADGEAYSLGDVLAWGHLSHFVAEAWRRLAARLGCLSYGNAHAALPSEDETRDAVRAWRRARQLAAADRTRAWLSRRGLAMDDLAEHARRRLAHQHHAEAWAVRRDEYAADLAEVGTKLPADLCFEGELAGLVRSFGARVVAPPAAPRGVARVWDRVRQRLEAGPMRAVIARWSVSEARLHHLVAVEVAHRAALAALTGAPGVARERARAAAALAWVEVSVATTDAESVARELMAAVDERPGAPLAAVARAHSLAVAQRRWVLAEVPDPVLRARLGAARPGELVGPVAAEGRWRVHQVLLRQRPATSAPEVERRALHRLLERELSVERERRVVTYYRDDFEDEPPARE